jgi:hypothetical protein
VAALPPAALDPERLALGLVALAHALVLVAVAVWLPIGAQIGLNPLLARLPGARRRDRARRPVVLLSSSIAGANGHPTDLLGADIARAPAEGDFHHALACVIVMSAYVVEINRGV